MSFAALLTLFAVVLAQMFIVGWLAGRLLNGDRSDFIMELPPIRLPKLRNILTKTRMRVWWYLGEAVPLFLVGTVLLFLLERMHALGAIAAAGRPVVTSMLGLPPETAQVLLMGFLRRDYGATGLFQLAATGRLSGVQAVVALTVMTLFVPCVANFLMIVKERGVRVACMLLAVITPIAVFTGAGLNYVLHAFGIRLLTGRRGGGPSLSACRPEPAATVCGSSGAPRRMRCGPARRARRDAGAALTVLQTFPGIVFLRRSDRTGRRAQRSPTRSSSK